MIICDKHAAWAAHQTRSPWRIRLVFRGANPDNVSGESDKFWEAYQDSADFETGSVNVRWGRIGSVGSHTVKNWDYVQTSVQNKLSKGYRYDPLTRGPSVSSPTGSPTTPPPRPTSPAEASSSDRLTGPFALISKLRPTRQGFEALDLNGTRLMTLTSDGAMDLAQKHNIPVEGYFGGG